MTVVSNLPDELVDYTIDWSKRGLGTDTISTSAWTVSDDSVTLSAESNTSTTTTVRITGGTSGDNYIITNTVTTAGGREMIEQIKYYCLWNRIIS